MALKKFTHRTPIKWSDRLSLMQPEIQLVLAINKDLGQALKVDPGIQPLPDATMHARLRVARNAIRLVEEMMGWLDNGNERLNDQISHVLLQLDKAKAKTKLTRRYHRDPAKVVAE